MSRYRIFEPINEYYPEVLNTTISSFINAHRNNDNAYHIKTGMGKNYLIIDGPLQNVSLNRMLIHELNAETLFKQTGGRLVNIRYQNSDDKLIIAKLDINEWLDGFSCNTQSVPMILTSNNSEVKIDFYSMLDLYKPTKIIETYVTGDIITKYRALMIKEILKNNTDKMYDYFVSRLIDKYCSEKIYEVKI